MKTAHLAIASGVTTAAAIVFTTGGVARAEQARPAPNLLADTLMLGGTFAAGAGAAAAGVATFRLAGGGVGGFLLGAAVSSAVFGAVGVGSGALGRALAE